MKVLVFSDLQADDGSDRLRRAPTWPLQRWRTREFYAWSARLVRERKLDAVWDLGDTTHNRSALAHPVVQTVVRGCTELTAGLSPLLNFKLLGNHEQHLKAQSVHVGDLFRGSFHVVEDFQVFHLPLCGGTPLTVICASFCTAEQVAATEARLSAAIERAHKQGARVVVLGHFAVGGSRLSSGSYAEGLSLSCLSEADLVLLGHVHRRQSLAPHVHYIGSPFQQDFGEAGDPTKVVAVVDLEALTVEWVEPRTTDGAHFPLHRIVTVHELAHAARSDDILQVQVRSAAEAELFYASPHAGTVKPVYAFTEAATEPEAQAFALDFDGLTAAYVARTPLPAGASAAEMLALASEFSH
jgi:hypothetical protein